MRIELILIIAIFIYGISSIVYSQYYIIRINALQKTLIKYDKRKIKTLEAEKNEKDAIIEMWYLIFRRLFDIKNKTERDIYMDKIASIIQTINCKPEDVYLVVYDKLIKPDATKIAKFIMSVAEQIPDNSDFYPIFKLNYDNFSDIADNLRFQECKDYGNIAVELDRLGINTSKHDDAVMPMLDPAVMAETYERQYDDFNYRWKHSNFITKFLLAGIYCGNYRDPYQSFEELNKALERGMIHDEEASEGATDSEDRHSEIPWENNINHDNVNFKKETVSDKVTMIKDKI